MTDNEQEAEELLQGSQEQTLYDSEAPAESADATDESQSLEDAIADAYLAIDDGEANEHVATRDRNLAALFRGLEDAGKLADLGEQAAAKTDWGFDSASQAELLRVLVRYSIVDLTEDEDGDSLLDTGREGLKSFKKAKAEQESEQIEDQPF